MLSLLPSMPHSFDLAHHAHRKFQAADISVHSGVVPSAASPAQPGEKLAQMQREMKDAAAMRRGEGSPPAWCVLLSRSVPGCHQRHSRICWPRPPMRWL